MFIIIIKNSFWQEQFKLGFTTWKSVVYGEGHSHSWVHQIEQICAVIVSFWEHIIVIVSKQNMELMALQIQIVKGLLKHIVIEVSLYNDFLYKV